MSTTPGAITTAMLHIRDSLAFVLAGLNWSLSTADTPFQKMHALAGSGDTGKCIISWKSDSPLAQDGQSLVIRAAITITLESRRDVQNPATGKLQGSAPRLMQIHDMVKGTMLALSMPDSVVPEPGAETPVYGGSSSVSGPDGVPLDAIEQTWHVELAELFSPEYTPIETP